MQPYFDPTRKTTSKKKDNPPKKRPKQKWKTNQSTKINLIGCDTIENSPSFDSYHFYFNLSNYMFASLSQKSFTFWTYLLKLVSWRSAIFPSISALISQQRTLWLADLLSHIARRKAAVSQTTGNSSSSGSSPSSILMTFSIEIFGRCWERTWIRASPAPWLWSQIWCMDHILIGVVIAQGACRRSCKGNSVKSLHDR